MPKANRLNGVRNAVELSPKWLLMIALRPYLRRPRSHENLALHVVDLGEPCVNQELASFGRSIGLAADQQLRAEIELRLHLKKHKHGYDKHEGG